MQESLNVKTDFSTENKKKLINGSSKLCMIKNDLIKNS